MQASITKYFPNSDTQITNQPVIKYCDLSVNELKVLCKKNGIRGYSKLVKKNLIEILTKTVTTIDSFELDIKKPTQKHCNSNILNHLVSNKRLILLQNVKTSVGNVVTYHPTTRFIFQEDDISKTNKQFTVIGYLSDTLEVLSLTKDMIITCNDWNFDYCLPENISNKRDCETKLNDDELDKLLSANYHTHDDADDDDDDFIPNYDEILI